MQARDLPPSRSGGATLVQNLTIKSCCRRLGGPTKLPDVSCFLRRYVLDNISLYDPIKKSRCVIIHTQEPLQNVAEAWALLRAIERKYGKVQEAQFHKDFEVINSYLAHNVVIFYNESSLEDIPIGRRVPFHIPAPVIDDQPGGLGLDDIKHLLESTKRDELFELPSARFLENSQERIIYAELERSGRNLYTQAKHDVYTVLNRAQATLFLAWGGFHKRVPVEPLGHITISDWFSKPTSEQVRMQVALDWCSRVTGFANPYNRKPTDHKNDGKVSDSSPASASMDSPELSSPTTLDNPITDESTSKSTQSRSLLTESPQSPFRSPPKLTQLPPKPTPPEPTIPPSGQLTSKQKKALQKQMSRAKQLSKQPAAKKAKKPEKNTKEKGLEDQIDQTPHAPDEEPLPPPIVAKFWKIFGR